ncbi:MAG: hypothetical protein JXR19_11395 [Bacteroidia bacterium]
MSRLLYILLILVFVKSSFAQAPILDSIKTAMTYKPRLVLGFHNRNTFVNTREVKIYGLVAGMDYNEKIKYFIALYGFSNENKEWVINSDLFQADSVLKTTSLSYFSIGAEYSIRHKGKLNIRAPLQIGIGSVNKDYHNKGFLILRDKDRVVPIEGGINAYYKLLPWFILKAGVGYRISLGSKESLSMSSPYYNLGISIAVFPLYRSIKKAFTEPQPLHQEGAGQWNGYPWRQSF